MPALTPEQRKKQQQLQRQAEAKRREQAKPKPGQKGVPTTGGSRSKGETIGGGKPQAPLTPWFLKDPEFGGSSGWTGDPNAGKPASKRPPATPNSKRDPEFRTKGGWTGDPNAGRAKPSATKPAVKPTVRPTTRTATASSGSSSNRSSSSSSSSATRSVPSSSTSSQTSNAGTKNQDKNYRGNLFEKTFGYKKGEAPDQRDQRANAAVASGKASKAEYNVSNNEGSRRLNDKSSSQQLSDTAKKIKDAADKSRASRQMSAGEQRYMAYLERQRKGQGNVIG